MKNVLSSCIFLGLTSLVMEVLSGCFDKMCPTNCTCDGFTTACSGLSLTKVPNNFSFTTHSISLDYNKLDGIQNTNFKNRIQLLNLNLAHNSISHIETGSFSDLAYLEELHLEFNNIDIADKDVLPENIFAPLSNLKFLGLDNNIWTNLQIYRDDFLWQKTKLQHLQVDAINDVSLPLSFGYLHSLQSLILKGGIENLHNDTFLNMSNVSLTYLAVWSGHLKYVAESTFYPLSQLQTLDLSGNRHLSTPETFLDGCYASHLPPTLKQLILQRVVPILNSVIYFNMKPNMMDALTQTELEELDLDQNRLASIADLNITNDRFPMLRKISLRFNHIMRYNPNSFYQILELKALYHLDISAQSRYPIVPLDVKPLSLSPISLTFPPTLQYFFASYVLEDTHNFDGNITIIGAPSNISVIDLSGNNIEKLYGSVRFISTSRDVDLVKVDFLNMSHCNMREMGNFVFSSIYALNSLNLSHNNLGAFIGGEYPGGTLLRQFQKSKLKVLDLSHNNFYYLWDNFFQYGDYLEKVLLHSNGLNSWITTLLNMSNIKLLDLSGNALQDLTVDTMNELDTISTRPSNKFRLDLSNNPLQCRCNSISFLWWLQKPHVKNMLIRKDNMWLYYKDDTWFHLRVISGCMNKLAIDCYSKTWIIWTGVTTMLLILVIPISLIIFRHRWDIRYFCIRLVSERQNKHPEDRSYEFDAFVSYNDKDLLWVQRILIPKLESPPNEFKLCVHHRDWLPGPTIEENICNSIAKSRKTLSVITKDFLNSHWCEFETQMARMKGFDEGREIIIVIALEEIPLRKMNTTVANLRRRNTWLQWPDNGEEREFWESLQGALKRPTDEPARCPCGNTYYPDGSVFRT